MKAIIVHFSEDDLSRDGNKSKEWFTFGLIHLSETINSKQNGGASKNIKGGFIF